MKVSQAIKELEKLKPNEKILIKWYTRQESLAYGEDDDNGFPGQKLAVKAWKRFVTSGQKMLFYGTMDTVYYAVQNIYDNIRGAPLDKPECRGGGEHNHNKSNTRTARRAIKELQQLEPNENIIIRWFSRGEVCAYGKNDTNGIPTKVLTVKQWVYLLEEIQDTLFCETTDEICQAVQDIYDGNDGFFV